MVEELYKDGVMETPLRTPKDSAVENKAEPPTPTLMPISSMLLQNSRNWCTMCSYSCLDHSQILPYGFSSFVKIHLHLFGILVTTKLDSLVEGQSRHTRNVQNVRTKFLKSQCSIQSLSLTLANDLFFTLILALYLESNVLSRTRRKMNTYHTIQS